MQRHPPARAASRPRTMCPTGSQLVREPWARCRRGESWRRLLHKALDQAAALCNKTLVKSKKPRRAPSDKPLRGQQKLPLGVPTNHSVREEYRRCGSARCPICPSGPGHGPYRYAVWREGVSVKRKYLGKA